MAKANPTDKTQLSRDEIISSIATKKADLLEYRKNLATGELKNFQVIRATKKEIARLNTALNNQSNEGEN